MSCHTCRLSCSVCVVKIIGNVIASATKGIGIARTVHLNTVGVSSKVVSPRLIVNEGIIYSPSTSSKG